MIASSSIPFSLAQSPLGISAISTYQPPWLLSNDWFESIPRKFVKHTGIARRPVSKDDDEVHLAIHAVEKLVRQTGCDLQQCAAVVFTSPSFVPLTLARELLGKEQAEKERLNEAANQFVQSLGIRPRAVLAYNTFCAGYATALSDVLYRVNPSVQLERDEFILVITSSRISRITDYACKQTAGLFGDMATATLLSRIDSQRYPVHFELLDSKVEIQSTSRPFFQFLVRQNVLTPTIDGGKCFIPERVVFSMDGMGVADAAPRAMASAAAEMALNTGWRPDGIQHIVPHQAGSAIVRLAEMKLRDAGFACEVVNGMTCDIGNVSSGSVPYTLQKKWHQISGNILCPIASVGDPGESKVVQGCIALRSTNYHQRIAA